MPDERDAVRAEIEQPRGDEPADDQDQRARSRRRQKPQTEDHRERDQPDEQGRAVYVPERAEPGAELAPGAVALRRRAGQLRKLPDDDVHRGTGEEARNHRLG